MGIGALVGVICGGRLSDWLFRRGWLGSRVVVPGVALLIATLLTAPAIWISNAVVGFALLTLGTAALAAANPPLDAARLDIVHARLWGQAESGRMALRGVLEGIAPNLFRWVSGMFGGGSGGLQWTFLIIDSGACSELPRHSDAAHLSGRRGYCRCVDPINIAS